MKSKWHDPQGPEYQYSNLFRINSLILPYVSIIGTWQKHIPEYGRENIVSRTEPNISFQLPEDFHIFDAEGGYFESKCRLINYDCVSSSDQLGGQLTFTFSKISYKDYLMSGEHL